MFGKAKAKPRVVRAAEHPLSVQRIEREYDAAAQWAADQVPQLLRLSMGVASCEDGLAAPGLDGEEMQQSCPEEMLDATTREIGTVTAHDWQLVSSDPPHGRTAHQ